MLRVHNGWCAEGTALLKSTLTCSIRDLDRSYKDTRILEYMKEHERFLPKDEPLAMPDVKNVRVSADAMPT